LEYDKNVLHLEFSDCNIFNFYQISSGKMLHYSLNTITKATDLKWLKIVPITDLINLSYIRRFLDLQGVVNIYTTPIKTGASKRQGGLKISAVALDHKYCDEKIWPENTPFPVLYQNFCEECKNRIKKGLLSEEAAVDNFRVYEFGFLREIKIAIIIVKVAQRGNIKFYESENWVEKQMHSRKLYHLQKLH
jgi:hypothetical protein